jgi:hypothetical protein
MSTSYLPREAALRAYLRLHVPPVHAVEAERLLTILLAQLFSSQPERPRDR